MRYTLTIRETHLPHHNTQCTALINCASTPNSISSLPYATSYVPSYHVKRKVKGCDLRYMALALKREHTTYRSLLMLAGAAVADPELMLARLVRAAVSPWPSLLAWPLLYMHPPRQGRLHKRQERKIGEPAAYQASLHRSDFGMDSFWPPEQRAVHGIHAYTRWPHAATSPSRMVVDAFDERAVAHAREECKPRRAQRVPDELTSVQARHGQGAAA